MLFSPFLRRGDVEEAQMLIRDFGLQAGPEAAGRAESSRNIGNAWHFCRWRQIERLIALLASTDAHGTIH